MIRITNGGAHGVLVASSSVRAYEQALTYVRKRGALICIGISEFDLLPKNHSTILLTWINQAPQKMSFPIGPEYFVARAVRLTGTSTGNIEDTKEALEYVRKGLVKPMTIEKTLDDIPSCIEALERGDAMGRFVVRV